MSRHLKSVVIHIYCGRSKLLIDRDGGAGGRHLEVASVPGLGLELGPAAGGAVAAAAPLEAVEAGARAAAAAGLAPGGRVGLLALLAIQQRLRGR